MGPESAGMSFSPPGEDLALAVATKQRRSWRGRLLWFLLTVFFLITLNFFLPRAMPGDPIDALLSRSSPTYVRDARARAKLERYYGLDRPLLVQYGRYLGDLAHGELGTSTTTYAPVSDALRRRLPWTLLLMGVATALATALGLLTGVHAGWRRDRPLDRGLLGLLLGAREFPTFLLGSLAVFVFAVKLDWFPLSGAQTPFADYNLVEQVGDVAHHLVLPALVLTVGLTAGTYLVMRAGMVSELGADYLLLGRAKGLREGRLKYAYAARNALLPVVSVTALQVGFLVTGDVLVERVFAYPGIGNLVFESIGARDYPMLQGCFLVIGVFVITVNFLADALYARLDPRTTA